jgi:hypothetical protein
VVTLLLLTLVGTSIFSLRLQRSVDIEGPTGADGRVIADETVRIMRR